MTSHETQLFSSRWAESSFVPAPCQAFLIRLLHCEVKSPAHSLLRVAAILFLNPAPLMWDFEHPPLNVELAQRYEIKWMLPSQCADQLADGSADIGLVPIASLATIPGLRILPGCTIASKGKV